MGQPPGVSPKDEWGNELAGPRYYQIKLDGIRPSSLKDLIDKDNKGELILWRFVFEDKTLQTQKPRIPGVDLATDTIVFQIPMLELFPVPA